MYTRYTLTTSYNAIHEPSHNFLNATSECNNARTRRVYSKRMKTYQLLRCEPDHGACKGRQKGSYGHCWVDVGGAVAQVFARAAVGAGFGAISRGTGILAESWSDRTTANDGHDIPDLRVRFLCRHEN